jgi:fermentation-respiration switch protein FrsA (DUF1100 family)
MARWTRIGAWLGLTLLMVNCNHLFYYPDAQTHYTPAELEITYDELTIPSSDGVQLAAWHMKPPAARRLGRTLVQFHGNAQNMTTHFMYVAWLVPLGFDVVTFDYRGYGRSTGDAERAGTVSDGQAVLKYVRAHPELGKGRVFALGQSLGGAIAVVAIATDPALNDPQSVSGLAVDSTFASYRGMARAALAGSWLTWPLQYPLSYLISNELSPVDYVSRLKMPFIAWHADGDPVVNVGQGKALFAAAPEANKRWIDVGGASHTAAFADEKSPHRAELVEFLKQ